MIKVDYVSTNSRFSVFVIKKDDEEIYHITDLCMTPKVVFEQVNRVDYTITLEQARYIHARIHGMSTVDYLAENGVKKLLLL